MKARLVRHEKITEEEGNTTESTMWQLSGPRPGKPHGYKYSLVCIAGNVRVIGYVNAEGKGEPGT